jgi:SAM-dependent methyltransferase
MQTPLTYTKYFLDRESYLTWLSNAGVQTERRRKEVLLLSQSQHGNVRFFCHAHSGEASLRHSTQGMYDGGYNWREFGHCSECDAITRIRLVAECIARASENYQTPTIYLTEQLTQLYKLLRQKYSRLVGSEYVPDATLKLQATSRLKSYLGDLTATIRHEDCCALTFANESVHVIGSFDVLEHIPDYRTAIREFARVLVTGGQLFLTAPFLPASATTLVRARVINDPSQPIEHLHPPEYHGNPTDPDGGALCFYHFGWDLLDELRRTGFRSVALMEAWSEATAIFGNQTVIVATK